jgi:hypothetical protein
MVPYRQAFGEQKRQVCAFTPTLTPSHFRMCVHIGVLGGAAGRAAAALQAYGAVQEVQRRAAQAGGAGVPHVPHPCAAEGQCGVLT